ncbi:hypothetical protein BC830DRAFT_66995 [Chytriomyces sp. MP71]|nr:hypothetical protein BC830DRAFT_66995 [Chytriomyces sp. MP71]
MSIPSSLVALTYYDGGDCDGPVQRVDMRWLNASTGCDAGALSRACEPSLLRGGWTYSQDCTAAALLGDGVFGPNATSATLVASSSPLCSPAANTTAASALRVGRCSQTVGATRFPSLGSEMHSEMHSEMLSEMLTRAQNGSVFWSAFADDSCSPRHWIGSQQFGSSLCVTTTPPGPGTDANSSSLQLVLRNDNGWQMLTVYTASDCAVVAGLVALPAQLPCSQTNPEPSSCSAHPLTAFQSTVDCASAPVDVASRAASLFGSGGAYLVIDTFLDMQCTAPNVTMAFAIGKCVTRGSSSFKYTVPVASEPKVVKSSYAAAGCVGQPILTDSYQTENVCSSVNSGTRVMLFNANALPSISELPNTSLASSSSNSNTGAIVGGVLGSLLIILLSVFGFLYLRHRRAKLDQRRLEWETALLDVRPLPRPQIHSTPSAPSASDTTSQEPSPFLHSSVPNSSDRDTTILSRRDTGPPRRPTFTSFREAVLQSGITITSRTASGSAPRADASMHPRTASATLATALRAESQRSFLVKLQSLYRPIQAPRDLDPALLPPRDAQPPPEKEAGSFLNTLQHSSGITNAPLSASDTYVRGEKEGGTVVPALLPTPPIVSDAHVSSDEKAGLFRPQDTNAQAMETAASSSPVAPPPPPPQRPAFTRYGSLTLPTHPRDWDTGDVAAWLAQEGVSSDIVAYLQEEETDGRALLLFHVEEFEFSVVGRRIHFESALETVRAIQEVLEVGALPPRY